MAHITLAGGLQAEHGRTVVENALRANLIETGHGRRGNRDGKIVVPYVEVGERTVGAMHAEEIPTIS